MSRQLLKDEVWLRTAMQVSRLSTCLRLQVGCVLLRADGSVAGIGYNGSLPGQEHCAPETCNPSARCLWTRHAERSALDYSAGEVRTAYVTHEPCLRCTLDLAARGVRRVVFGERYLPNMEEVQGRNRVVVRHKIDWVRMDVEHVAKQNRQEAE